MDINQLKQDIKDFVIKNTNNRINENIKNSKINPNVFELKFIIEFESYNNLNIQSIIKNQIFIIFVNPSLEGKNFNLLTNTLERFFENDKLSSIQKIKDEFGNELSW